VGRKRAKIIVVAEDAGLRSQIAKLVGERKVQVDRESSIDRLVEQCEAESYEVVVIAGVAFKSGDVDSIDLLDVITAQSPNTQVLFLVKPRDIRIAMSALESGAHQYAKLPASDEELWFLIDTAIKASLRSAKGRKRRGVRRKDRFEKMAGRSDAMQNVYGLVRHAAASDIPVLLLGETGTGKDLAAQAIHAQGERSKGPYVPVNLGALPRELVASELFGSEKGAFTGATETREGKFEQANDGTIFLDEIAMMDEKVQVALLRLLERKKFHRLGGRRAVSNNARLIAATNHDLLDDIKSGTFRKDLYYRLDVFRIVMPPLRERPTDIPLRGNSRTSSSALYWFAKGASFFRSTFPPAFAAGRLSERRSPSRPVHPWKMSNAR